MFEPQRHSTSSRAAQPKETATAVDGDGGSDSDSDDDDDVIPPYFPPLPKKETNEDGEIWSLMEALTTFVVREVTCNSGGHGKA